MSLAKRKINASKTERTRKIDEALRLLNEAASEARSEVADLVKEGYEDFEDQASNVINSAKQSVREGAESIKKTAKTVDKQIHQNPWAYIGGTALSALALGFLLGKLDK